MQLYCVLFCNMLRHSLEFHLSYFAMFGQICLSVLLPDACCLCIVELFVLNNHHFLNHLNGLNGSLSLIICRINFSADIWHPQQSQTEINQGKMALVTNSLQICFFFFFFLAPS